VQETINAIFDLGMRQAAVTVALFSTIQEEDRGLAETWRDINRGELAERFPHRSPAPFPVQLFGRSLDLLRHHPRYGYVAGWLGEWFDHSRDMQAELRETHGLTAAELDAVLNSDRARRRGEFD